MPVWASLIFHLSITLSIYPESHSAERNLAIAMKECKILILPTYNSNILCKFVAN